MSVAQTGKKRPANAGVENTMCLKYAGGCEARVLCFLSGFCQFCCCSTFHNHSRDGSTKPPRRQNTSFLPARRYASAGNSDRNVSVCLSDRHTPVLWQNEETSWFLHHLW